MFLLGTCQTKCSSPCNVPDMFLPVSRYPRPQCVNAEEDTAARGSSSTGKVGKRTKKILDEVSANCGQLESIS